MYLRSNVSASSGGRRLCETQVASGLVGFCSVNVLYPDWTWLALDRFMDWASLPGDRVPSRDKRRGVTLRYRINRCWTSHSEDA